MGLTFCSGLQLKIIVADNLRRNVFVAEGQELQCPVCAEGIEGQTPQVIRRPSFPVHGAPLTEQLYVNLDRVEDAHKQGAMLADVQDEPNPYHRDGHADKDRDKNILLNDGAHALFEDGTCSVHCPRCPGQERQEKKCGPIKTILGRCI